METRERPTIVVLLEAKPEPKYSPPQQTGDRE